MGVSLSTSLRGTDTFSASLDAHAQRLAREYAVASPISNINDGGSSIHGTVGRRRRTQPDTVTYDPALHCRLAFVDDNTQECLALMRGLLDAVIVAHDGDVSCMLETDDANSNGNGNSSGGSRRRGSGSSSSATTAGKRSTSSDGEQQPQEYVPVTPEEVAVLFAPFKVVCLANRSIGDAGLLETRLPIAGGGNRDKKSGNSSNANNDDADDGNVCGGDGSSGDHAGEENEWEQHRAPTLTVSVLTVLAHNLNLTSLDLSFNQLTGRSVTALVRALWVRLDDDDDGNDNSGCTRVVAGTAHLRHLSLAGNPIGREGCASLACWLSAAAPATVTAAAAAPSSSPSADTEGNAASVCPLTSLSLFHCGLDDDDVIVLLSGLVGGSNSNDNSGDGKNNTHDDAYARDGTVSVTNTNLISLNLNFNATVTERTVAFLLNSVLHSPSSPSSSSSSRRSKQRSTLSVVRLESVSYSRETHLVVPIDGEKRLPQACTPVKGRFREVEGAVPPRKTTTATAGEPASISTHSNSNNSNGDDRDGNDDDDAADGAVAAADAAGDYQRGRDTVIGVSGTNSNSNSNNPISGGGGGGCDSSVVTEREALRRSLLHRNYAGIAPLSNDLLAGLRAALDPRRRAVVERDEEIAADERAAQVTAALLRSAVEKNFGRTPLHRLGSGGYSATGATDAHDGDNYILKNSSDDEHRNSEGEEEGQGNTSSHSQEGNDSDAGDAGAAIKYNEGDEDDDGDGDGENSTRENKKMRPMYGVSRHSRRVVAREPSAAAAYLAESLARRNGALAAKGKNMEDPDRLALVMADAYVFRDRHTIGVYRVSRGRVAVASGGGGGGANSGSGGSGDDADLPYRELGARRRSYSHCHTLAKARSNSLCRSSSANSIKSERNTSFRVGNSNANERNTSNNRSNAADMFGPGAHTDASAALTGVLQRLAFTGDVVPFRHKSGIDVIVEMPARTAAKLRVFDINRNKKKRRNSNSNSNRMNSSNSTLRASASARRFTAVRFDSCDVDGDAAAAVTEPPVGNGSSNDTDNNDGCPGFGADSSNRSGGGGGGYRFGIHQRQRRSPTTPAEKGGAGAVIVGPGGVGVVRAHAFDVMRPSLSPCWCTPKNITAAYGGQLHFHCRYEGSTAASFKAATQQQQQEADTGTAAASANRSARRLGGKHNSNNRHGGTRTTKRPPFNTSGIHTFSSSGGNNTSGGGGGHRVVGRGGVRLPSIMGGPPKQPYHACRGTGHSCASTRQPSASAAATTTAATPHASRPTSSSNNNTSGGGGVGWGSDGAVTLPTTTSTTTSTTTTTTTTTTGRSGDTFANSSGSFSGGRGRQPNHRNHNRNHTRRPVPPAALGAHSPSPSNANPNLVPPASGLTGPAVAVAAGLTYNPVVYFSSPYQPCALIVDECPVW